jgi:hypothetical protein
MLTTFPCIQDLRTIYGFLREQGLRFFPLVQYYVITNPTNVLDEVHLEIDNREKTFSPTTLHYFAIFDKERHPLTRYGGEELRNVTLQTCVPLMVEAGIALQDQKTFRVSLICQQGDRFMWEQVLYDVLEIRRGPNFANSDVPLYYEFLAERVRFDASDYSDFVQSQS